MAKWVHIRILDDEGRDASGINVDRRCPRVSTLSTGDWKLDKAFSVAVNLSSNFHMKLNKDFSVAVNLTVSSIRSWVLESSEGSTHPELSHAGSACSELYHPVWGPPVEAISLVPVDGEPPGSVISVDSGGWRLSRLSLSQAVHPSVSHATVLLAASAHEPHDVDWSVDSSSSVRPSVTQLPVAQPSCLYHVLEGILDVCNANDADKKGNGKLEPQ